MKQGKEYKHRERKGGGAGTGGQTRRAEPAKTGMRISIVKGSGQRYSSLLHRRDGVCVELVAGGYNKVGGPAGRVPHDLAHFIVEEELQLRYGLWGVLSAGALLDLKNTIVVGGRQAPHAVRRSQQILEQAGEGPAQAEIIVRVVADLALAGKHRDVAAFHAAVGERWALPGVTADQLETACRRLQEGGAQWDRLKRGETIDVVWQEGYIRT